jgi:hypothetical protein
MAAWKTAEQRIARKLQKAAGVVRDEVLRNLVTSTGRVGHLTELGFDILVGNGADGTAIVGEVKRKKYFLSADAVRALLQIFARGIEYGRTPMLGLTLSEDVPGFVDTNRGRKRLERGLAFNAALEGDRAYSGASNCGGTQSRKYCVWRGTASSAEWRGGHW